jgi:hypothetical protein
MDFINLCNQNSSNSNICGFVGREGDRRSKQDLTATETVCEHLLFLWVIFHSCRYVDYIGCFKKGFTTLREYTNLYRGHTQRFELS